MTLTCRLRPLMLLVKRIFLVLFVHFSLCSFMFIVVSLFSFPALLCQSNQVGHSTNLIAESANGSHICDRCNSGKSFHLLELSSSREDCVSGHFYPVIINHLCECRFVCAHESRQSCRQSVTTETFNINQILCNTDLNLKCNEKTNLCEGKSEAGTQTGSFQPNHIDSIIQNRATSVISFANSASVILY